MYLKGENIHTHICIYTCIKRRVISLPSSVWWSSPTMAVSEERWGIWYEAVISTIPARCWRPRGLLESCWSSFCSGILRKSLLLSVQECCDWRMGGLASESQGQEAKSSFLLPRPALWAPTRMCCLVEGGFMDSDNLIRKVPRRSTQHLVF